VAAFDGGDAADVRVGLEQEAGEAAQREVGATDATRP
jgi:hypothetical protein